MPLSSAQFLPGICFFTGNQMRTRISKTLDKIPIWVRLIIIGILVVGASVLCCHWFSSDGMPETNIERQEHQQIEGDKRKERWEEYKIHTDLFKYYLDLVLRTNLAFFAITGAIITFYFKNKEDNKYLKKALLLPLFMSQALAGFYIYSACLWGKVSITVNHLREDLGIERTPDIHILSVLLVLFGVVFLVTGEALAWFLWTDKPDKNLLITP